MEADEKPQINHFVYMGGITPYTIRQLILSKSEALIGIIEREAEGGNWKAADALLRYAMPPAPTTGEFELPSASEGISAKIQAILEAIGSGRLPPIDGARLLDSLAKLAQLESMQKIEQQIKELRNESNTRAAMSGIAQAIEELQAIRDQSENE